MYDSDDAVLSFVSRALSHRTLAGLCEILGDIAVATGSFGAILWELAPGADLRDANRPGQLFVLADWLENTEHFALHDLPLGSITGEAVLGGSTVISDDVPNDPRVYRGSPERQSDFMQRYGIRTMISVPLDLPGGSKGAINLYRNTPIAYAEHDEATAIRLSTLVPDLYQSLREKTSFNAISRVKDCIQCAESDSLQSRLDPGTARVAIQGCAEIIAESFQCLEASIYLSTRAGAESFELVATTCKPYIRQNSYKPGEPGLTGWTLKHRRPIKIFDLIHFDRDKHAIQSSYDGVDWQDRLRIEETARRLLAVDVLPPLSFMAVPVMIGEELLGVIRCCSARCPPYYYADGEVTLLSVVASQVAHYWSNWIQRREMRDENHSLHSLVASIRELNTFVEKEINKSDPNIVLIFEEGLKVAGKVVRGAEIMDVRLCDVNKRELYFAAVQGSAWHSVNQGEDDTRRLRRFALSGRSAGAWVFHNNRVRSIPDVSKDEFYAQTFPGVRSMVIAPISSSTATYGVMDVRILNDGGVAPPAEDIVALLGQQLGLYQFLAETVRELRSAKSDLTETVRKLKEATTQRENEVKIQTRAYQDLEHQLKGPISQAHKRIQNHLRGEVLPRRVDYNLQAVRGLVGKARRVVRLMGVFFELAKGSSLPVELTTVYADGLIKMLIETCADNILLEGQTRGLRFTVDESTFQTLSVVDVQADLDLLAQALNNVVDNACKYSFNFKWLRVRGGLDAAGHFFISVSNFGLPLRADEVPLAIQRNWRGREASYSTGQGSGIGLWFVHQVMLAQGGDLQIIPTTPERVTEVRLLFPTRARL